MKKKIIIGSVIAILIVIISLVFVLRSPNKEMKLNTSIIAEETVEVAITATGYVQPVDKVDAGTQVSGVIEKIYVDFNTHVKKGQLLAELDKSTLAEKLSQAEASQLSAQSDLTFAQQNYDRIKKLYESKAATEVSYEDASNKLTQAKTSVINTKANVHQAKVNLSYAEIYSPIDGIVLNRAVEQGQTVAASFSTPTLFTIAKDLKNMQVEANVDEADIGQIHTNQLVHFNVDAYPDITFTGTVQQIRLQPTVTNNVVTYTVIINTPNPDEKLYPGMTANVTIIARTEKGVAVPNEALNFKPSPEIMNSLKIKNSGETGLNDKSVWVKKGQEVEQQKLETGLTDGIYTIVTRGLEAGDEVILSGYFEQSNKKNEPAATNPLMPKRPGGRR